MKMLIQLETKSNKGINPSPKGPRTIPNPQGESEKGINPSPKGPKILPPGTTK